MENHPIPQDITGFQFKLIGKMTIKQFVYLAAGAILAWLFFFVFGLPFLIKTPLAIISFTLGAGIAFVPIDGRPMDTMIGNFIRALLSPTQFIYQKNSGAPSSNTNVDSPSSAQPTSPIMQKPTQAAPVPSPEPISPPQPEAKPELPPLPNISEPQKENSTQANLPDPTAMSADFIKAMREKQKATKVEQITPEMDEKETLKKQIDELQKQLESKSTQEASSGPTQTQQAANAPVQAPSVQNPQDQKELENMLAESIRQKEALEKQIIEMKTKQASAEKQKFAPVTATQQQTTRNVRKVPADMASSIGLPSAPEAPNLITGIIKDPRGNPIPNILVEIKDPDSNPVRAFKTNKLGKFASATPLSNGNYVISFEDSAEKHKFDDIEMELVGASVMPLEIISVDPREELRRELFN